MECSATLKYKKSLQNYLGDTDIYLYWKGRVGLFSLLKAMGVGEGDEVILPAFTCVVVPNAILYLGAMPVYVDIDPETFNMDVSNLESAVTTKTKVILAQNTYGLSTNVEKIVAIAKQHNLYTIEDCTHGFGGKYEEKPNGSYCDAAFYSTQWNKPHSTGIGGFALLSNEKLKKALLDVNQLLDSPSAKEIMSLRLQLFARKYFLVESTYWKLLKVYRFLSSRNLVVGSSSSEEINSINMPKGFLKSSSSLQAKAGLKAINNLKGVITLREKNASIYTEFLKKNGKNHVLEKLNKNHSFLKYPLRVSSRDDFFKCAEKAQISLGDWFTSPLHPVENDLHLWHFEPDEFPHAMLAASQVINLPTDLNKRSLQRVLTFLKANLQLIL